MHGYVSGITVAEEIKYCPRCGDVIYTRHGDGTATCDDCDYHFGVVECDDD